VFLELTCRGAASCVGVSKAVLLVTRGAVGPALDSQARRALKIRHPRDAEAWITCLQSVSEDIVRFESRYSIRLEELAPDAWRPLPLGRVYDMMIGPREQRS
jgi:hypothetical protein